VKPSARATARATVDLPAPAGPSMATSMAAATIGHVKLLRPLRERDFALLWTGMTVSLLGDAYAGAGASAAESGSGTPAIS
jgi:hypothetical protein